MASGGCPSDSGEGPSTSGKAKKRKHEVFFKDEWLSESQFKNWLRKKDSEIAECIWCHCWISVRYQGKDILTHHAKSMQHKEVEKQNILTPLVNKPDSSEVNQVIVAEVVEAYHGVMHHHSYASQGCTNKLLPRMLPDSGIAKKISCGWTKATNIVENILAPKSMELLLEDLDAAYFFSIGCDTSNKGNRKFFPVTVRYFSVTEGIKEGLLGFYNDDEETSEAIVAQLCSMLQDNGLSLDRVSSYVADHAAVNFGKHKSVFQKLKQLNKRLIDVGCKCHVLHNCLKMGKRALSFNVEVFVTQIYSEFSSSARSTDSLRAFFEFVDAEYKDLIQCGPPRWLSLMPAIETVLHCWSALRVYFLSCGEEECEKIVWEGFSPEEESSLPLCYTYFLYNLMALFNPIMKKLENTYVSCTELHRILDDLHEKLKQRRRKQFYGRSATAILVNLSASQRETFQREADQAFSRCIDYLEKWYDFDMSIFKDMALLSLDSPVMWDQLDNLVNALNFDPDIIDTDKIFDDFCIVSKCQEEISSQEQNIDQRWVKMFRRIRGSGDSHLLKLVSFALSVPVSNAYSEKVSSLMMHLWSKERNQLSDSLVKAELQVKLNFRMSCEEFCNFIKSRPELLKAARRQDKYYFPSRKQKAV
ncbi:uncharacterized protein LOC132568204 [Heteronotia binoei]|uniref:uncharacterized protein LOC132568204 n=1 Tax=Heteronotia binoei TaxID=13085 RepID=UPI002931C0F4|nr:uncharacterized protein LOC132568204 [Heteronotia binoei]